MSDLLILHLIRLGNGTICTGSSNLLIGPGGRFASNFCITHVQEKRHIIVRKPTECVSGQDRRGGILLQSSGLIDFDDSRIATD